MTWRAVFENPTKVSLTKTQQQMLRGIVEGEAMHDLPLSKGAAINVHALERLGLVRRVKFSWGAQGWEATDAGRALVQARDNPTKPERVQVVLARVEEGFEVVRPGQSDIGIRAKLRPVPVPKALMWLRKGTAADVAKAEAHARSEGWRVFTYPISERDPLGRAKKDVLR